MTRRSSESLGLLLDLWGLSSLRHATREILNHPSTHPDAASITSRRLRRAAHELGCAANGSSSAGRARSWARSQRLRWRPPP